MVDGFTKNVAYLGPPAAALLVPAAAFVLAVVPWCALAVPSLRTTAAAAIAATFLGRIAVARVTRSPAWSALFHPVMITIWTGIALRSWWRRVVQGRLEWRGRVMEAPR
jgi:hypothetical protein